MLVALHANPVGLQTVSGTASATTQGNNLNVQVSQNAVLNWASFNIKPGETTTFNQPNSWSVVWNHINDPNPSQIYGTLNANGIVVLANQAGFYFGPKAMVNAAGFVATTAGGTPPTPIGAPWQFTGPPPTASIINYGEIRVAPGGSLYLIGEQIENHGTLSAPQGNVGLYAAQEVLLSERPDGRGLTATVRLPQGSVDNRGKIVADAGTIALHAQVVNQGGLIQANSVRQDQGVVELVASEAVNLQNQSVTVAQGDRRGPSPGGNISIRSGGAYSDQAGAVIDVAGGPQGGNGGQLELSAARLPAIQAKIDGRAEPGYTGGRALVDPTDIVIGNGGSGQAGAGGTVHAADPPTTLNLNVNSSFQGFAQITLQATHNISLAAGTSWDLAQSTGHDEAGCRLTLQAGNDIQFGSASQLLADQHWSVSLSAGVDFASGQVAAGKGNVNFAGNASLQTGKGDITILAGNGITVGQGFVHTTGGGNVSATALAGSINTGKAANGYLFADGGAGYSVDTANLGGLSTGAGGNVTLAAGQDVASFLPTLSGTSGDGGSGAFGPAPGNVSIIANGNVTGHYVIANGTGKIQAGNDAGLASKLLALSLVKGSWEVHAGQDINLQEVRNPNGVFNRAGFSTSTTKHLFDYDPQASVELTAGNAVNLLGTALPRNPFESGLPILYPPQLQIDAGAGGVVLGNNVTLFPSPQGQLQITTTGGGSLQTVQANQSFQLGMSDSAAPQWSQATDFTLSDHSAGLLHLNDPNPVRLNISGSIQDLVLWLPKAAVVNVAGDVVNSSFLGQNLHPNDTTLLNVSGNIQNRNEYTLVTLDPGTPAPDFTMFDRAQNPQLNYPDIDLGALRGRFTFNAATRTLALDRRLTPTELQVLLNLQVWALDSQGQLAVDFAGNPIYTTAPFVAPAVLQQLFTLSQDVPETPPAGYQIGGPGKFQITAKNMDLGVTKGVVSLGPQSNPQLAQVAPGGADIDVELAGNLSMYSSSIQSISGGNIHVLAQGAIDVGSAALIGGSEVARGIFSSAKSDVQVIAQGNIELNGSRIAAYDGGNVHVESLNGNVDAGSGAQGYVRVDQVAVDPVTHQVSTVTQPIPGSGIVATTFPDSPHAVGNIAVETPHGNILANAGGILQLALNQNHSQASVVSLSAGSVNPDGSVNLGSIAAGNSGVIGSNVKLQATKDVTGLIFSKENIDIQARQNVAVTALAQGGVSLNAGGNVSGTVIGVNNVSVGGGSVNAALLSQNVSVGGNAKLSSSQTGFAPTAAASSTSQSVQNREADKLTTTTAQPSLADQANSQASKHPGLRRTIGRVTVLLPNS